MRLSTGLVNMLVGGTPGQSLRTIFSGGVVGLFGGPQPSDADMAESGTLAGYVTINGGAFTPGQMTNGLVWDAPVNGVCVKPTATVWAVIPVAEVEIAWARIYTNTRVLGASAVESRIDLTCGVSSGDMRWASLQFEIGIQRTIDVLNLAIRRFL